jgi:hypothetical protein
MNRDEEKKARENRYGEELLSANWNPVIELLERSCNRTRQLAERALREEDADAFLGRVYTFGT